MDIFLLTICVSSLYLGDVNAQATTAQPSSQPARIEGPAMFVTDGTRELTLTFHTNTTVSGSYVWILPGSRLCSAQVDYTCTFRPTLEDDEKTVKCALQDSSFEVLSNASYNINLSYPPTSSPSITLPSHTTQPLKQGDVIACSVSGGKPLVTNVTFHCLNPDLADQEDDVSDDGSTVSSNVTVDTSSATEHDMTCSCSAFWEPEPGLYQNTTDMAFQLGRYKASVASFSVNGTEKLTVNDTDRPTVAFACDGVGRPSPVLRLYKKGNQTVLGERNTKEDKHQAVFTIEATSADMGTYMCVADNSFPEPDHKTVQLFVNSVPKRMDNDDETDPPVISLNGHTFTLVGYPTPTVSEISFLGNKTGSGEREAVSENAFSTQCSRNLTVKYLVDCEVTPLEIPEDRLGSYSMTVSNEFGSLGLHFRITSAGTELGPNGNENLSSGAIAGVVLGTLLFVALLVFAVIFVKRGRSMKSCRKTDKQLNDVTQFAAETQDLQPIGGLRGSRQQQQQHEHEPQSTSIQSQEHGTVTSENTTETHTYINEGNTYDVLQRNQQDDGRIYTTLMTSSRAANRRHPAGVSSSAGTGDYEIP